MGKIIDKHADTLRTVSMSPEAAAHFYDDIKEPDDLNFLHTPIDVKSDAFDKLLQSFTRSMMSITDGDVSKEVRTLITRYYRSAAEDVLFSLHNPVFSHLMYNVILRASIVRDDDDVPISCHRVFTTETGYRSGVHFWKISYLGGGKESESRPYGGIGIVSDNNILRKENQLGNFNTENSKALHWLNNKSFGDCYYLDQMTNCIYCYQNGKGKILYSKKQMKDDTVSYQKGDELTVYLDCIRGKLSILRNGTNVLKDDQEIDLVRKNIKYYPVIAFYYPADTYRALKR